MPSKPILLLADSQLLFLKNNQGQYYLQSLLSEIINAKPSCAYIGASNGDEPAFFDIFKEAMNNIGLYDCRMINSSFNDDDREYLDKADLILLAGGDTELGLRVFKETRMEQVLQKKYAEGTIFIGVSAGAVQLGWLYCSKKSEQNIFTDALKFVPFIVVVHPSKQQLVEVETILHQSPSIKRAYEIPFGGGLVVHPDNTVEAIRKPINEFIVKDESFSHTFIFPQNDFPG